MNCFEGSPEFSIYRELLEKGDIVIIDDHKPVHRVLKLLLGELGLFNIRSALLGKEGLYILSLRQTSMVICDFHLGDMTAIDIIKHMRSKPENLNTPFLMITSDVSKEELLEARLSGVSSCIVKPFTLTLLEDKLIEAIDNQKDLPNNSSTS